MATPNKLRTQAVDTSKTTPEAFLAGATPAPVLQPPDAAAAAAAAPAPEQEAPSGDVPAGQPGQPIASGPLAPLAADKTDPAAPKKEALPVTPEPFVLLWKHSAGKRSVRVMEVHGGCILAYAVAIPEMQHVSTCFVPGVKLADGKLVAI